jgi:hypothetical protein
MPRLGELRLSTRSTGHTFYSGQRSHLDPPIRRATLPLDLERLRAETPGVAARVHLNNAGAGLMPAPVLDAMIRYLRREAEIGGYEAGSGDCRPPRWCLRHAPEIICLVNSIAQ